MSSALTLTLGNSIYIGAWGLGIYRWATSMTVESIADYTCIRAMSSFAWHLSPDP
jgi:hypothetical protein